MSISQAFQQYVNLVTIAIVVLIITLIIGAYFQAKKDDKKIDIMMKDLEKLLTEKELEFYKSNPEPYKFTVQLVLDQGGNLEPHNDAYIDNLSILKNMIKNDISKKENEEKNRRKIREQLASNEEPLNPFMDK